MYVNLQQPEINATPRHISDSLLDLLVLTLMLWCCCNLVKKMEFNVLDSQNLLTEVLFDPVQLPK